MASDTYTIVIHHTLCVFMSIFIHYRYVLTVAKARGVVWKGLSTEKILARLDLAEYMEANGQVMFVSLFARRLQLNQSILTQTKKQNKNKKTTRWVPLRDTTRLLHCMFAGGDELITMFSEMGTPMTRFAVRMRT